MMNSYEQLWIKICEHKKVQKMKKYIQHGCVNTFTHCCNVTYTALRIANKLHLSAKAKQNIVIGAMLHDFYLYDYHVTGRNTPYGIHAFSHPKVAMANANAAFLLNKKQKNIILSHMFPVTILYVPKSKEAWIVNVADKYCAAKEYLWDQLHHKVWEAGK